MEIADARKAKNQKKSKYLLTSLPIPAGYALLGFQHHLAGASVSFKLRTTMGDEMKRDFAVGGDKAAAQA